MSNALDSLRLSLSNQILHTLESLLRDIEVFELDHPDAIQDFLIPVSYSKYRGPSKFQSPLASLRYAVESLRDEIIVFSKEPSSTVAFAIVTGSAVVQAQPAAIRYLIGLAPTLLDEPNPMSSAGRIKGWLERLDGAIEANASQIWALVAPYLALKQCVITGTVSTPALASFVGGDTAQVTLTFER
ncbi:MAG: hypothetical protein U0Q12_22275 [Vicinamibacterales bacterium]